MKKQIQHVTVLLLISGFIISSCNDDKMSVDVIFDDSQNEVPAFDADSAYAFIETQVEFGPRNPNSEGHVQTGQYLENVLRDYSDNKVFIQEFSHEGYDETLQLRNIIAAFNPEATKRILLCAHWDTRPRADRESDPDEVERPILGADDGGSGVGILLELARIFKDNPPPIGVDIIFFDGEDYGNENDIENYFLGARYWSANPPVQGYMPKFGILLDIVGGVGATFPKEGYSMTYAPSVVNEVWAIAEEKGYGRFVNESGRSIADDHFILNTEYGLPTINIIHQRQGATPNTWGFPLWWHTHSDNMDIIDKSTLQEVGDVLLELIYNRIQ